MMYYIIDLINSGSLSENYLDENFNKTTQEVETEKFLIKTETWTSHDGKVSFRRTSQKVKKLEKKVSIEKLKKDLEVAIKSENFEKAAELRDKIKSLKEEIKTS